MTGNDSDDVPEAVELVNEEDFGDNNCKPAKHVPVTLITGFLGAGKTTLVKHILTSQHGLRIAVILNEFGEEGGIEQAFMTDQLGAQAKADEWVELTNGCLCCSVKTKFVQALESLMSRRNKFDYIVVETTGLANPGPIASALWTDEELEAGVQLDAVITVVDGLNISKQVHEPRADNAVNEAQVQIAFADLVLLNKMDLAEEEAVDRAVADIRAINSSVHIMHTTKCMVDVKQLLHRQGYSRGREELPLIREDEDVDGGDGEKEEEEEEEPELKVQATRAASFVHSASMSRASSSSHSLQPAIRAAMVQEVKEGHSHALSEHHEHDNAISTISLQASKPLDLDKFKSWVDHLLWDRETFPEEIYRMKGILNIAGSNLKHSFQAVYELYDVVEGPAWTAGEQRRTRITIIGRKLDVPLLRDRFKSLQLQ